MQKDEIQSMVGKKAIVTTDNWFYGPSGRPYRAAFGTIKGVYSDTDTLGIKTNARSTNWYLQIGSIFIAGCQVHYVLATDEAPRDTAFDFDVNDGKVKEYERPSYIYNADLDET